MTKKLAETGKEHVNEMGFLMWTRQLLFQVLIHFRFVVIPKVKSIEATG